MEVLGQERLHEKLQSFKQHEGYRKILAIFLKYEIQHLVQQLAQTGEESVLLSLNVTDGAMSVMGSDSGERFMQNQTNNCVALDFMKQFIQFCNGATSTIEEDSKEGIKMFTGCMDDSETNKQCSVPDKFDSKSSHLTLMRSRRSPRKKPVDKTDETVSALVQTIMKVGKEKEVKAINELNAMTEESAKKRGLAKLERKQTEKTIYNNDIDTTIDTKVSQLVQNIKAQAELKEKQRYIEQCRKRRISDTRLRISYGDESNYSGPKKKARSIADCFPNISNSVESLENSSSAESVVQTVIKVEPVTDGYEDDIKDSNFKIHEYFISNLNNPNVETSEEYTDGIMIKNVGTINEKDFNDRDVLAPNATKAYDGKISRTSAQNTDGDESFTNGNIDAETVKETGASVDEDSSTSTVEVVLENDLEEEELELPFVEEFYKRRGDVTLKEEEMSDDPDVLYKSSVRKPGKFNLVHHGYSYIRDKIGRGNTVYWKCGRFLCRGRVIQRNGENIRTKDHNHPPTVDTETMKIIQSTMNYEMNMEHLTSVGE